MKLQDFLDETGITAGTLARKASIAPTTIYGVLKGKEIYLSMAMKIERATKRKVKCQDLANEQLVGTRRRRKAGQRPSQDVHDGKDHNSAEDQ